MASGGSPYGLACVTDRARVQPVVGAVLLEQRTLGGLVAVIGGEQQRRHAVHPGRVGLAHG